MPFAPRFGLVISMILQASASKAEPLTGPRRDHILAPRIRPRAPGDVGQNLQCEQCADAAHGVRSKIERGGLFQDIGKSASIPCPGANLQLIMK